MPKPEKTASAVVNAELQLLPSKVALTPLGLDVTQPLTLDEWRDLGRSIGTALRSAAFVIGDWLVYGEGRDAQLTFWNEIAPSSRVEGWLYQDAARLTGLDVTTLHNHAYVARRVPRSCRNEHLSWEHHKRVAKLKDTTEQRRWLTLAARERTAGNPVSVRRLARSIEAGRLLAVEELEVEEQGIENVHPHVNRIVTFFARLRASGWLETATREQRDALKRDLQPIIDITKEL